MSPAYTAFYITAGGLFVFAIITLVQGDRLLSTIAFKPVLLLRYAAEIVGTLSIVLAVSLVPLSTVGAILQASPLLVAAGAVLFLGERVSWRRWSAIGIGFIGVLLIVKPASADFDANVLWALLAMLGLSARDLTTRATPDGVSTSALATYTMVATAPCALIWVLATQDSLIAVNANWLEVSVVSPYRYSRLLFLLVLGILLFDERPDFYTLLGAAIIVLSGIYTMWRDRVVKQSGIKQSPANPSR